MSPLTLNPEPISSPQPQPRSDPETPTPFHQQMAAACPAPRVIPGWEIPWIRHHSLDLLTDGILVLLGKQDTDTHYANSQPAWPPEHSWDCLNKVLFQPRAGARLLGAFQLEVGFYFFPSCSAQPESFGPPQLPRCAGKRENWADKNLPGCCCCRCCSWVPLCLFFIHILVALHRICAVFLLSELQKKSHFSGERKAGRVQPPSPARRCCPAQSLPDSFPRLEEVGMDHHR